MDRFIRIKDGRYFYIERRLPPDGNSENYIEESQEITGENDIAMIKQILDAQGYMQSTLAYIPCWNPECNEVLITTKEQKRDFEVRFYKKYGKIMLPFCCKDCRDRFYEMMKESEKAAPAEGPE